MYQIYMYMDIYIYMYRCEYCRGLTASAAEPRCHPQKVSVLGGSTEPLFISRRMNNYIYIYIYIVGAAKSWSQNI